MLSDYDVRFFFFK